MDSDLCRRQKERWKFVKKGEAETVETGQPAEIVLPGGKKLMLPSFVVTALRRLEEAGFEAYAVGGCVRDSMLGIPPHDYDLCTDARPEEMQRVFAGFPTIATGLRHGTLTVLIEDRPLEITAFRVDGSYTNHRKPDRVTFTGSIGEDLARRDFTVNAMACSLKRGFAEAENGSADLAAGVIRCVGEPERRFQEDALRILRAMRFAARYGFTVEPGTLRAMKECRKLLAFVSRERIFSELCGLLSAEDGRAVSSVLEACRDITEEILSEVSPEEEAGSCPPLRSEDTAALALSAPILTLRFALFLLAEGKDSVETAGTVLTELRAPKKFTKEVCLLLELQGRCREASEKNAAEILTACGEELAGVLFALMRCRALARKEQTGDKRLPAAGIRKPEEIDRLEECALRLLAEKRCLRLSELAVSGDDMMALGCPPGKPVGEVLRFLLTSVAGGSLQNERDVLCRAATEYLGGLSG